MLKYFLIFAILLVMLTLFADYSMVQTIRAQLTDQAQSRLEQLSEAAASYSTDEEIPVDSEQLQQFATARCKETGKRFEILDGQGKSCLPQIRKVGRSVIPRMTTNETSRR